MMAFFTAGWAGPGSLKVLEPEALPPRVRFNWRLSPDCGGTPDMGELNLEGGSIEICGPKVNSWAGMGLGLGPGLSSVVLVVTGCHGELLSCASSCLSVTEIKSCLSSSICFESSIKRLSVKVRRPIIDSVSISGLSGFGVTPMRRGLIKPSASSWGLI